MVPCKPVRFCLLLQCFVLVDGSAACSTFSGAAWEGQAYSCRSWKEFFGHGHKLSSDTTHRRALSAERDGERATSVERQQTFIAMARGLAVSRTTLSAKHPRVVAQCTDALLDFIGRLSVTAGFGMLLLAGPLQAAKREISSSKRKTLPARSTSGSIGKCASA